MEQRRLMLAFALSLGLLILYQELVVKRYQQPQQPQEAPASVAGERENPPSTISGTPMPPKELTPLAAPIPSTGGTVIETDTLRVVITPAGGRLESIELKDYRSTVDPQSAPLDLIQRGDILPGTLQLGSEQSDAGISYRPDKSTLTLQGDERGDIVLTADTADGLRVEKRYTFNGRGYAFDLVTSVSGEKPPDSIGLVLTPPAPSSSGRQGREVAVVLHERKFEEVDVTKVVQEPKNYTAAQWGGFAAQYFMTVAVPGEGNAKALAAVSGGIPIFRLDSPLPKGRATFSFYTGPKERDELVHAGHDLERAIDFGWFWFIAIPLLRALRVLHTITGNYGVAIIVLTSLVKLATVPLTQTTFRNMREMQKIQPQMAKLRERFKDDQVALQKEMMELYKRHRVNPFSGCLPMVLQLPIFVGLYNALMHAIELRHAPFALWINDLSAPDRLMVAGLGIPVLTLLMGASMFAQQRLMPQQGDPTQQRMMMFMPLVFTFMFINFPAGLVLYWLVNNVLSIGQQYYMMRTMT